MSYPAMIEINDEQTGELKVKIYTPVVEPAAMEQLQTLAKFSHLYKHLAVMPDVHASVGSAGTVGTVIATVGAIIPSAVGVDIGCGMLAVRTNIKASELPDSCEAIRKAIEDAVPVGFSCHEKYDKPLSLLSMREYLWLSKGAPKFLEENKIITNDNQERLLQQIGTLGGGNHFIELCLDEKDNVWIMLHSGSRGVGNRIGTFYIARAKDEMQKLGIKDLASADLSYFNHSSRWWDEYMSAVKWAQEYASMNRRTMLALVVGELVKFFPHLKFVNSVINCHHNYISQETHFGKEVWITRKGAVSARKGEKAIIPGSMGARSYIVEGLGDPESYCSCPHGAGRKMSRGQAKKTITTAMHEAATVGVSCKKDESVLDESPAAYKDIDEVLKYSNRLVKPLTMLKQFVCVKG